METPVDRNQSRKDWPLLHSIPGFSIFQEMRAPFPCFGRKEGRTAGTAGEDVVEMADARGTRDKKSKRSTEEIERGEGWLDDMGCGRKV